MFVCNIIIDIYEQVRHSRVDWSGSIVIIIQVGIPMVFPCVNNSIRCRLMCKPLPRLSGQGISESMNIFRGLN